MILIADSGSTKTSWVLLTENGKTIDANTQGFNPYFQTSRIIEDAIRNELSKEIILQLQYMTATYIIKLPNSDYI